MIQIPSDGAIIKNISTYPKLNICSHHMCSRLHKSSDLLSLLPSFAIKACRIVLFTVFFGFLFTALAHHLGRIKRIWDLSPMQAAKVQANLRIRAVSPEPPLLAHTNSETRGTFRQKARSLAPLNGWACAILKFVMTECSKTLIRLTGLI